MQNDDKMLWIEKWEQLRRLAYDNDFHVAIDRHKITIMPGIMKAADTAMNLPNGFNSVEELEAWLQGVIWQTQYAKALGWEQDRAEKDWREERDRQRILRTLSKD